MENKSLILSRNIIVNFVSYIIVLLATFFTTPFILKNLGQTYYGLLVLLSTIINFFLAFDFGFTTAFVQAFAKKIGNKQDFSVLFLTSFIFYLFISIFWALITFISAPYLLGTFFPVVQQVGSLAIDGLRVFSLILFLNALGNFFSLSLKALQKYHLANLQLILAGTIIPIGSVYLLKIGMGLKEIIYFHLVIHAGIAFLLFFFLKCNLSLKIKKVFSWSIFKELFSFAKWRFISQLAGQIRQKSGRFFLTFYLNLNNLAFFTIPQNLGQRYVNLLPNITTPIFTMTAQLTGEKNKKALSRLYCFSVKLINVFLLPIGVFLFFYGQDFLSLWINPVFAQKASPSLKILSVAFSLFILNGLPNIFLEGKGKPELPAKISILIVVLFLIFSFVFIPRFGLLGAALATMFPYMIQVPFYLLIVTKKILGHLKWQFFLTNYFYPILLALSVGIFLNSLKGKINSWFVFVFNIILFLTVYGALIIIFKIITKEEKKLIIDLWKSLRLS